MGGLNYEPRIIEAHAQRLERRAESMGITSIVIGVVIGGFFGAVPLTSLGDSWPVPSQFGFATLLVGMLIGAVTGYVIGDARAFGYRLQAQSSLCQLHLERNTAALLARAHQESRSTEALLSPPEPTAEAHIEPAPPRAEFIAPEPEPEPAPLPALIPLYLEPEPAPPVEALRFDVAELQPDPEPEPEPIDEVTPDLAWFTEPQSDPEPMPEPARLVEAPWPEVFEPDPEPIRLAEAPRLDIAESLPEPEPEPEPALPEPAAEATPTPADLESMSLEEIARLSNSGLI